MTKLIQYKPVTILLIFIVLILIIISCFTLWVKLVPDELEVYGPLIIEIGFFTSYVAWIYLLGYGFKLLDTKTGNKVELKKFGNILLTLLLTISASFLSLYFISEKNFHILQQINVVLSLVGTYCFLYTIIKITKNFKFYDKRKSPSIFDYIVTMLQLCFFPFGLMMMHAHLKLLLKDYELIKK